MLYRILTLLPLWALRALQTSVSYMVSVGYGLETKIVHARLTKRAKAFMASKAKDSNR